MVSSRPCGLGAPFRRRAAAAAAQDDLSQRASAGCGRRRRSAPRRAKGRLLDPSLSLSSLSTPRPPAEPGPRRATARPLRRGRTHVETQHPRDGVPTNRIDKPRRRPSGIGLGASCGREGAAREWRAMRQKLELGVAPRTSRWARRHTPLHDLAATARHQGEAPHGDGGAVGGDRDSPSGTRPWPAARPGPAGPRPGEDGSGHARSRRWRLHVRRGDEFRGRLPMFPACPGARGPWTPDLEWRPRHGRSAAPGRIPRSSPPAAANAMRCGLRGHGGSWRGRWRYPGDDGNPSPEVLGGWIPLGPTGIVAPLSGFASKPR